MAIGAGSAAAGASTAGEAVTTQSERTFAKDFAMTAKDNFVQQFTGWNQGGMFVVS